MPAHAHTRLLLLAVAVALFVSLFAGVAGAREDDPLTRYDSPSTQQLAAEYERVEKRAEEIETRIEELEEAYEYGDERDRLMDELAEMPDETQMDNALGNARLSDVESAPLPDEAEPKAEELRRKAASLDALDRWAETSNIDIDSRLYGVLGGGEAEALASTYRQEAGALEVAAHSEEVAREEVAPKPEPEPEPEPETQGAAPGAGDGGGEKPVEDPELAPEEVPTVEAGDSDGGFLGGVNLLPIAVFAALVVGGIFALSRSAGVSVGKFFSPAMAQHRSPKKTAPKKAAPKPKTKAASVSKTTTSKTEEDPETRPSSPEPEPEPRTEPETIDSAALAEWFEKEIPTPPERPKLGPRDEAGDDDDDDDEPPV